MNVTYSCYDQDTKLRALRKNSHTSAAEMLNHPI